MPGSGEGKLIGDGKYQQLKAIGRGAFGEVWLAKNVKTGEEVRLQCLPAELAGSP